MAFVFQSSRKITDPIQKSDNMGPGYYYSNQPQQIPKSFAPFNTQVGRDFLKKKQQVKPEIVFPGPGQYQITQEPYKEKVLVSTVNQDIKIIEVPKVSSSFKSNVPRLAKQVISDNPGPGSYGEVLAPPQKPQKNSKQAKKNLILEIKQQNKYQSIPSIPVGQQAFGYSENNNDELILNKNPNHVHLGIKHDTVGPGQYNIKGSIEQSLSKKKGLDFSKSKVTRAEKISSASTADLGPGKYNPKADYNPLYKMKASSCFSSSSSRSFDNRKGIISNKLQLQKAKSQAALQLQDSDKLDLKNDFEYIEDANPGPGYYHNDQIVSSIQLKKKPEKFQFFDSSSKRFASQKKTMTTVAPGDYESEQMQFGKQIRKFNQQSIPFQSVEQRFDQSNKLQNIPGPGTYDVRKTLNKAQNQNLRQNFGSDIDRFAEKLDAEDIPGPGTYTDQDILAKKLIKNQYQQSFMFKSTSIRENANQKHVAPPVGTYDVNHYNIDKNVLQLTNEDPEFMPKKVPFSSSEKRFDFSKPKKPEIDLETEVILEENSLENFYSQKQKTKVPFNAKADRFCYDQTHKKANDPGPLDYQQQINQWNKRTYNINFAGI